MPRPRRTAVHKPVRRHGTLDAQLEFDFAAGASLSAVMRPAPVKREPPAQAFEPSAKEENDALLTAAVRRLRTRSVEWNPPLLSLAPKAVMGRRIAKAGRERNDAALEWAGMQLMGYRRH